MSVILVVAPHPDDETLGCGGTLLRHHQEGDEVHWIVVTTNHADREAPQNDRRDDEITRINLAYSFASISQLGFYSARLDLVPIADLVEAIREVMERVQPDTVYVPHVGDAHSDHGIIFNATAAACKWFRASYVKRLLAYETLSETNFSRHGLLFKPTIYKNIESFLAEKLDIMQIYESEIAPPPFPRSLEAIQALALLRGSESGCLAAEAFELIKEID
ncbi:MAG: PIG-L family deacetylase [Burkholderiales bacterium]|nr:PIG-L family deacetylase [Burkholderiales bacterium]